LNRTGQCADFCAVRCFNGGQPEKFAQGGNCSFSRDSHERYTKVPLPPSLRRKSNDELHKCHSSGRPGIPETGQRDSNPNGSETLPAGTSKSGFAGPQAKSYKRSCCFDYRLIASGHICKLKLKFCNTDYANCCGPESSEVISDSPIKLFFLFYSSWGSGFISVLKMFFQLLKSISCDLRGR